MMRLPQMDGETKDLFDTLRNLFDICDAGVVTHMYYGEQVYSLLFSYKGKSYRVNARADPYAERMHKVCHALLSQAKHEINMADTEKP